MNSKHIEPYLNRFHSKTWEYDYEANAKLSELDAEVRKRIMRERDRHAENAPLQGKPRPTKYKGVSID